MPLGRAGPSAFCLVLAVWGHVIPLDLSPAGLDRGTHSLRYRSRGALFARGGACGLFPPSAYLSLSLLDKARIDFVILSMISNHMRESRFIYFLVVGDKCCPGMISQTQELMVIFTAHVWLVTTNSVSLLLMRNC